LMLPGRHTAFPDSGVSARAWRPESRHGFGGAWPAGGANAAARTASTSAQNACHALRSAGAIAASQAGSRTGARSGSHFHRARFWVTGSPGAAAGQSGPPAPRAPARSPRPSSPTGTAIRGACSRVRAPAGGGGAPRRGDSGAGGGCRGCSAPQDNSGRGGWSPGSRRSPRPDPSSPLGRPPSCCARGRRPGQGGSPRSNGRWPRRVGPSRSE
jgi:hypothetical protein